VIDEERSSDKRLHLPVERDGLLAQNMRVSHCTGIRPFVINITLHYILSTSLSSLLMANTPPSFELGLGALILREFYHWYYLEQDPAHHINACLGLLASQVLAFAAGL
jgi:hypothetical protein